MQVGPEIGDDPRLGGGSRLIPVLLEPVPHQFLRAVLLETELGVLVNVVTDLA